MNPRDAGAYLDLGEVCRSEGRLPEAEAALKKALELEPQNGWVHCQLGRVYRKQGRSVEAEAALKKSLELEPENGCARLELGVLYQDQGGFVEAAVEFEKRRAHGVSHFQLGREVLLLGCDQRFKRLTVLGV